LDDDNGQGIFTSDLQHRVPRSALLPRWATDPRF
jgi:hypothetical protein